MTPREENHGSENGRAGDEGVLSKLPRTRPQRASARRSAAREAGNGRQPQAAATSEQKAAGAPAASGKAPAKRRSTKPRTGTAARGATATTTRATAPKATRKPAKAAPRKAARDAEPVPRQGFESDEGRLSGTVAPPGGAEILATAAEAVSELTKAGVSAGERMVRDLLSRLPLS